MHPCDLRDSLYQLSKFGRLTALIFFTSYENPSFKLLINGLRLFLTSNGSISRRSTIFNLSCITKLGNKFLYHDWLILLWYQLDWLKILWFFAFLFFALLLFAFKLFANLYFAFFFFANLFFAFKVFAL